MRAQTHMFIERKSAIIVLDGVFHAGKVVEGLGDSDVHLTQFVQLDLKRLLQVGDG